MHFGHFATVVVAALLVACGGAQARKVAYMAKGREYYAAHNFDKARLEFRNAVQLDPNDAEASFMVGQADERLGNGREAAQMYQDAIQSNGKHLGARAQLGMLYVLTGAPDKAMSLIEPGLAIAPDDPDLLTARAAARQQMGDKVGARADAEKAVHVAPANESATVLLASIYSDAGESGKAIDLVSRSLQSHEASANLYLVLAQLYLSAARHAEAVRALQRAVVIEPTTLINRYRLAQVLLLDKDVDAAEAVLRAAIAQAPDSAEAKLVLANLLASKRTYEVADSELRRMIAASPSDYQLRFGLAQFYANHNKPHQAEATYRQIIKDDGTGPNGLAARNRLASSYLAANKSDAAAPLVDEVLKENPRDNDALITRAHLYLAQGKADAAITDLRAVQRDQPNSIPVQLELARAYLQNNDETLAEETLRSAAQTHPANADVQLELAQLLVRAGRLDQASPILEKLATAQPGDQIVLETLFRIQMSRKDYDAARRTAALLQVGKPELPIGNYLSGLVEEADAKPDAARAAFERAAVVSPDAVEPVNALVRLDLAQQHPDQAVARLDKIIARLPNNAIAHNLKGEVLAELKRADAAVVSFREAIKLSPSWEIPYHNLAAQEIVAGRSDDAIRTLQNGINAANDVTPLLGDLASLYERSGRPNDAIAQYESVLQRHTDSSVAANNLAMLLVTYHSDKSSLDRARAVAERFASSRDPQLIDTWGWVLYKRGENADAINVLQKAVTMAPQTPVLRYHLAMAQLKSGAREPARANLEQALKGSAPFSDSDVAKKTLADLNH